jgi:hypothetical protein
MFHNGLVPWIISFMLLTSSVSAAPDQTAMRVSIGGSELPANTQPRVTVEAQIGAVDQARIRVTGLPAVGWAGTIAAGDDVDIDARTLDGSSIPIFRGEVISLEPGFDQEQPFVLIRASSALPRADSESRNSTTARPGLDGDARLVAFFPRLSSTSSIQEVLVTGVDSSTGGPIVGRAVAPTILLGSGPGGSFGSRFAIDTDRRFASAAEVDAFAASLLAELLATRISAEVATDGSPEITTGSFVEIEGLDEEFNGEYYVAGVTHQFRSGPYGGYSSIFRVRRADFGMFRIPELDDEVLVAFEQGDLTRPYEIGSLWECDAQRTERPEHQGPCRLLRWPW